MKASAPDARFCLIGGDLADEGTDYQLAAAREVLSALHLPLYATPGNHDYRTDDDRSAYEQYFPNQINHRFEEGGWQFIGLDTTQGTQYEQTAISTATFDWLERELPGLDSRKPTVIFTHFPFGQSFNYRPLNSNQLLERLGDLNLQAVLSGHWHAFSECRWRNATLLTDSCCSRVRDNHDGSKAKGWLVCEVEGHLLHREFVEIPEELYSVESDA
jgi:3',5'-cyclic AMP phosphodiesterase CpdA